MSSSFGDYLRSVSVPVYTGISIAKGALVSVDASGYARNAGAGSDLKPIGIAAAAANNTSGASGAIDVLCEPGVWRFANGDTITFAHLYKPAFAGASNTVYKASNSYARYPVGVIVGVDAIGVSVLLTPATVSLAASAIVLEDDAGYYTATDVEQALAEVYSVAALIPLETNLALTTTPGGASYVGVFDTATLYTGDTVEACLAEVKLIADAAAPSADLALTTTPGGASYIGVFDTATLYTGDTVEACLAEVKVLADAAAPSADLASVATGDGASLIGVEDANNRYTGADVEAILDEIAHPADLGAALGDADANVQVTAGQINNWRLIPASTLSAGRVYTLITTGAQRGDRITISRADMEAFTATVANGGGGGGTIAVLAASKRGFVTAQYDGTNWYLFAVGNEG